jgi:hypothetical protein
MSDSSSTSDQQPDGLRFYLAYDYLTAAELARLTIASHSIYEALFWVPVPAMIGVPHDSRRSLQVREARTGDSIYIDLVNTLGRAVEGLDPSLAGVGGGVVVTALTARVMIHAFNSGHRAFSAARRRNIEVADQRFQLDTKRAGAEIDAQRSFAVDAEYREFVYGVLSETTTEDFLRALRRDQSLTDAVAAPLLDVWSVFQHDNIRQVAINGATVKPDSQELGYHGDPVAE